MLSSEVKKFILGTVQFGQAYGATNFTKKLEKKKIFKILSFAWENEIHTFDTAPSYNTEKIIGEFVKTHGIQNKIKIITKVSKIPKNINCEYFIKSSIEKSQKYLGTRISTLFFHHPGDIGRLIGSEKILQNIQKEYNIKKIGFSIYSIAEKKLLDKFSFRPSVQYPLSVANRSFESFDFGKGNNFVRSIFLQGLLINKTFNKNTNIPPRLVKSLKSFYYFLNLKGIDPLKLSLSYITKLKKNIDGILFGVDNIAQVKKIINCRLYEKIDYNFITKVNKLFNIRNTDPRSWK
jgi:aryl-alcohol dehydrogenase-like predicted oxidoreductase